MRLQAYSELTGEVIPIGLPSQDLERLANLGETMATNRDSLIVFVEGLQPWEDDDE